ncbi:efflux RND transporter periplasmic adaptor subunit [Ferribacterium limneticum]|uniref:efflux RND transporter periplasmic adaptor subunit n=1 Tax=Ferribacterium limneticum TaxID=76259 RepID=UPI001CFA3ADA|nr:efflux RND transporter periplasmic adaptor subunit [Ferribacterium limneticum]UCV28237.1 efflux RND transporter periplasmic adaptor subunit [Ferribacterium limneticum]UCV32154.1 efflux RND transporter periplasmic adaptor subunit [Ferribacterium limneticum]
MTQSSDTSSAALVALLSKNASQGAGRRRWWLIGGGLAIMVVLLVALSGGNGQPAGQYQTEEAAVGNLLVTASASGTLQPTKSVDVGSELSGTLSSVLVQENDVVKKGQLLAQLDTAKLKDAVAKSQAAVAAAEASVALAQATVAETTASLNRMRQVAELSGGKVPAKTELETADAARQRAIASLASARADVVQARATLKTDETNLGKATIRSPVDGVVLTRKVEPGQTVAAQMTTPVLFVLAEDLAKMELQVKVDEADVGNVKVGQTASFTVSAWPGRQFPASIQRVGLGSTTTDNVVTYKTILRVNNDDLALRPGMTATASIVTASRDKVLLVPNAALRFTPPGLAAGVKERSLVSRLLPGPPPEAPKKRPVAAKGSGEAQVWVLVDGQPQAAALKTGVSNGRHTEVLDGDLPAGAAVITDYQAAKK